MRIDIASTINFGDVQGLRQFFLDHYFAHNQISQALSRAKKGSFSTIGIQDALAEDAWVSLMQEPGPTPSVLRDWLLLHAEIHQTNESRLSLAGVTAPDLSIVDFSIESQFYDWMYVHQQMHAIEQTALGLK